MNSQYHKLKTCYLAFSSAPLLGIAPCRNKDNVAVARQLVVKDVCNRGCKYDLAVYVKISTLSACLATTGTNITAAVSRKVRFRVFHLRLVPSLELATHNGLWYAMTRSYLIFCGSLEAVYVFVGQKIVALKLSHDSLLPTSAWIDQAAS